MNLIRSATIVLSTVGLLAVASSQAQAQKKNKRKDQLPAILLQAQFVYVEAYDGDEFDPRLLPQDRRAIAEVANAVQKWGRYRLTMRRSEADLVIVVRKGRLASATGRVGVSIDAPSSVRIPPSDKTQTDTHVGAGAEVGPPDDLMSVHMVTNGDLGSPLWRKSQKDGLEAPDLKLFQNFKEEVEATAAQAKNKKPAPAGNTNGSAPAQKPDPNHP